MKKLLTISILFFILSISAQETLDLFSVVGRYGAPQSYDSTYKSKAKEQGIQINLVAPIKINEKSIWYNSINYFGFHVSNDEQLTSDISNPINIHGIILRTGLYHKFSEDRNIQVFFSPRLMSDFNSIDKNHFQFGGMLLYNKKHSETLTLGFGLNYNQELFGPYIVPLVNLDWKLNNRWSIKGLLPIYMKIKYKINDKFNIGYHHFGLITTYSLGAPEYKGDYMERNSIDETIFARYHITKNIHVEGRFGYALGRSYAQYESDQKVKFSLPLVGFGDDRVQKNISFESGLITSLRLVYNIPISESK
ncbi:MAG: hypothetical protein KAH07_00390 [Flavobacteriaceae bacterium]|nr:hypothetical protein [Flavobacteriaceae bacterium]